MSMEAEKEHEWLGRLGLELHWEESEGPPMVRWRSELSYDYSDSAVAALVAHLEAVKAEGAAEERARIVVLFGHEATAADGAVLDGKDQGETDGEWHRGRARAFRDMAKMLVRTTYPGGQTGERARREEAEHERDEAVAKWRAAEERIDELELVVRSVNDIAGHNITVMVDSSEPDDGVIVGAIPNECKCGGELEHGFGLAGGGYGPCATCKVCPNFYKAPIEPGDE